MIQRENSLEPTVGANPIRSRSFLARGAAILSLLLPLVSFQCFDRLLEPVAPASDIQLSIPLVNRTKYFSEMASKDTSFRTNADGSYFYASSKTVKPISIDTIKVTPRQSSQQVFVGTFAIDPPAPVGDTLQYREIAGSDPPSQPTPTPSQTFLIPGLTTAPQATFQSAVFETGNITLLVRNKFPFPIDFPNPIIIKNGRTTEPADTNEVARFSFGSKTFQPGEQSSVTTGIANVLVQNSSRVPSFSLHAQPSSGPVVISQQSGIEYVITLSNLVARSATAKISPQAVLRTKDSVFAVDDSVSLQSATFRSGTLDVVLDNTIDLDAKVTVTFKELLDRRTGAGFTLSRTFNGKGTARIPINAADVTVHSSASTDGTRLSYSARLESVESQEMRQVKSVDFITVQIEPRSPFVVQSLTGRIKPTRFTVGAGAGGINTGELSDILAGSVTFDSVRMALRLSMASGFPTDYNLRLVALNRRTTPTRTDSLVLPAPMGSTQMRFFPGPGSTTQIILDNSTGFHTFLSRFFPNFPDTFIVRGSALMNPPDIFPTPQGIQTVYDTSKIYTSMDVSFPLKFALRGQLADTVNIERSQNESKDLARSTVSATMYFEVTNGMPVRLGFGAALLRKSASGKQDSTLWVLADGPKTIAAASVDQSGTVTTPRTSAFSIRLSEGEAQKFNDADALYYSLQIETAGGGTIPVRFRKQDFVTVRASANMVYTMNKQ